MKIRLADPVAIRLLTYALATKDEFSGFGFCERKDGEIYIYDFVLLACGSFTYTEIDPKTILPLLDRPDADKMKVWLHRHPVGNGIPGPHNWSGTDEHTILHEPMGSHPNFVKWSVSVVLTHRGWVGRIDNYVKDITQHLEVEPAILPAWEEMAKLQSSFWQAQRANAFVVEDELEAEEEHDFSLDCSICGGPCEYVDWEEDPVYQETLPNLASTQPALAGLPRTHVRNRPDDRSLESGQRTYRRLPSPEEIIAFQESQLRGYYQHGITEEE